MAELSEASDKPITVLLRERRYLPGDKVAGKVRINVREHLSAYSIYLVFRGLEQSSEGFHAVGGSQHEEHRLVFFNQKHYIVPATEPQADKQLDIIPLARGSHLYDFSFDIPRHLPASFKLDSWASVSYDVTAHMQLAGKSLSETCSSDQAEIYILGISKEVQEEKLRRAEPQQGTSISQVGFSTLDTVKLQVKVEKDAVVMGQPTKIKLILNNHSSRQIKQASIALHQRLLTVTPSKVAREVLLASVVEKQMPLQVSPNSGVESNVTLMIPSPSHRVKFVCCPSLVGRLFRLEHYLVATVPVPGLFGIGSTDVVARLAVKVLIGHPSPPPLTANVVGFEQHAENEQEDRLRPADIYKKTFTLYSVTVKNQESSWRVQRRYSEFDALRKKLSEEFDSVPHLPPKRPLAKVDPSFLVERQEALDQFLRRVTRHPDIGHAPALLQFLDLETFTCYSSPSSPSSSSSPSTPSLSIATEPPAASSSTRPSMTSAAEALL